jgi:hypothetical protein
MSATFTPVVTNTVSNEVITCPANVQNVTVAVCSNEYLFNGWHLTQSGNYTQKFTTTSGCDSVVNLTLTLYPVYSTTTNQQICEGDSALFYGQYYSQSGNYSQKFTSVNGCDSTEILSLVVNATHFNIAGAFCSNSTFDFNGQTLAMPGTYVDTLINSNGCDSIVLLTLQQTLYYNDSITQTICMGQSTLFGGSQLTLPGVYTEVKSTVDGCDSITTLTLNVNPAYNFNITETICAGQSYYFGGNLITQSGVYTETLATTIGCDSSTTLTLIVEPVINNTVTQAGDTLTALQTNTSYQWYDCISGNPIAGAMGQQFVPSVSGYYRVLLTSGNCVDSSLCQFISITGIDENTIDAVTISPNPSNDNFVITSSHKMGMKVFDSYGKLIMEQPINAGTTLLKAKNWSTGMYFLKVNNGENVRGIIIVKE